MNRRMENPMQLYFCSYEGKIKETMTKHNGSEFWDVSSNITKNVLLKNTNHLNYNTSIIFLTTQCIYTV